MKIKFLGAAETVTGSKYLLSHDKESYLVDCGLFQGMKDLTMRNWQNFHIDPRGLKAIFLTHAHIDHTGYIPRIIEMGFKGPIYCSMGTFELAKILLPDSGHLQEEEAMYANKKGYSRHHPALPLYTREQAEESLKQFKPLDFHKEVKISPNVSITLKRVGHILGASSILVKAANRRITFSGDVGRYDDMIMRPPEPLEETDYLVIESTYGDREHPKEDIFTQMAKLINNAQKRGGVIMVPAFAVGRAQHILHIVHLLKKQKRIGDIDVYLDSPMAIDTTDLYCRYHDEHRLTLDECRGMCQTAIITKSPEESKAINEKPGCKIIISASGMASGGRILHHMAQYIGDEKNVFIIVGFQAEGTRGRAILEKASSVQIFGKSFAVRAKVANLQGLSAHADYKELIRWLNESNVGRPKVFVTHGEKTSAKKFAERLRDTFHWTVEVPKDGSEYDL